MTFSQQHLARYKQGGFLEDHASGRGITQRYIEKRNEYPQSQFYSVKADDEINIQDIFNAYKLGDMAAMELLENAVVLWGLAIANLISMFNPEKIILGGSLFAPAAQFIPKIRSEAFKWAQPVSIQDTEILLSALGADMGLIGAGRIALMLADRSK